MYVNIGYVYITYSTFVLISKLNICIIWIGSTPGRKENKDFSSTIRKDDEPPPAKRRKLNNE